MEHPKAYNSGVCVICREKTAPTSFAARRSPAAAAELEEVCIMAFAEQSRRAEDREYAQQMGYSLDRKISTRRPGSIRVDTQCSVQIGDTLYHVGAVDYTDTELYLQLAEVRRLA